MTGHIDILAAAGLLGLPALDARPSVASGFDAHSRRMPDTSSEDEMDCAGTSDSAPGSLWSKALTISSFSTSAPPSLSEPSDGSSQLDQETPNANDKARLAHSLELRADSLLSPDHLRLILCQDKLLFNFNSFLLSYRPADFPVLQYYLTAQRALDHINTANDLATSLVDVDGGFDSQSYCVPAASHPALEHKLETAFSTLHHNALPAYVAHAFHTTSAGMHQQVVGALASGASQNSDGLAQMFCLTDPSQRDNPIIFASKEFSRQTQFPLHAVFNKSPNFLQGPRTDACAYQRISEALQAEKAHSEVILNYRRDGSPFLNLLTVTPLRDTKGQLRYWLRGYIDCSELIGRNAEAWPFPNESAQPRNGEKLGINGDTIRRAKSYQSMYSECSFNLEESGRLSANDLSVCSRPKTSWQPSSLRSRVILNDDNFEPHRLAAPASARLPSSVPDSRSPGIYHRYLLVRPTHPFRILFASPAMQIPRMVQSPFMSHIGGDKRVRAHLQSALEGGRKVTAKITWLSQGNANGEGFGRMCWAHCTPLFGEDGQVGVWTVLLLDEASHGSDDDVK